MNWAAYGRSVVFAQDTRFACFLSLSVTRLEKLQYPPFFYTCISSLLLAIVDTFSSTAVLHRALLLFVFDLTPFCGIGRGVTQRETERERQDIHDGITLQLWDFALQLMMVFDARELGRGWDGWIRNLALHPSPDQKQNRTVQLKGN